jgi:hypothetical protein
MVDDKKEALSAFASSPVEKMDKILGDPSQVPASYDDEKPHPHPLDVREILLARIGKRVCSSTISPLPSEYDEPHDRAYEYEARDQSVPDQEDDISLALDELCVSAPSTDDLTADQAAENEFVRIVTPPDEKTTLELLLDEEPYTTATVEPPVTMADAPQNDIDEPSTQFARELVLGRPADELAARQDYPSGLSTQDTLSDVTSTSADQTPTPSPSKLQPPPTIDYSPPHSPLPSSLYPKDVPPPPLPTVIATTESNIPSALASLYLDYWQSISKLTFLSPKSLSSIPTDQDDQVPSDDQIEYVMSKQQLQLTIDEGKMWDELVADAPEFEPLPISSISPPTEPTLDLQPPTPEELDTAQATLMSLAEKSSLISQSYERRNNPPTAQTYEECKEIIRALGVPCLDSDGPYEAEALAASLVINGHADYVASEDTVSLYQLVTNKY